MLRIFTRSLAFVLGLFSLANFLHTSSSPGLNPNLLWIDLRFLTRLAQSILLLGSGISFLGVFFFLTKYRRGSVLFCIAPMLLWIGAVHNTIQYYALCRNHEIYHAPLLPFSLFVALGLLLILVGVLAYALPKKIHLKQQFASQPNSRWVMRVLLGISFVALGMVGVPVLQMLTLGRTDFRRPADVVVVFGAHTYADGRLSMTLQNRVRTACELYRLGYVQRLIFSGGPGEGRIHETEAMRDFAIKLGVSSDDILLDRGGINTQATVQNTIEIFRQKNLQRILVVSDFSHVVRIKLTYAFAGQTVYTVPAQGWRPKSLILFQMGREVAALWLYYIRGLTSSS